MEIRKDVLPVLKPAGGEEEIQAVADVINSGWWGKGPKVAELEEKFAKIVNYLKILMMGQTFILFIVMNLRLIMKI